MAGNWKMNLSIQEAGELASAVKRDLADCIDVETVLCPPFTALKTVSDIVSGTHIKLGAQNMHWEKSGAFTGEVSAAMLRDMYCRYVILGHSERRSFMREDDAMINHKMKTALASTLLPILCVGETLQQREGGDMKAVVRTQVRQGLAGIAEGIRGVVIAYEPVWAIGTGRVATPDQAQEVHAFIRSLLAEMFDAATADSVRIQYGGSVKPANARELFAQPDIDGGLIGGASLEARAFVEIVKAATGA